MTVWVLGADIVWVILINLSLPPEVISQVTETRYYTRPSGTEHVAWSLNDWVSSGGCQGKQNNQYRFAFQFRGWLVIFHSFYHFGTDRSQTKCSSIREYLWFITIVTASSLQLPPPPPPPSLSPSSTAAATAAATTTITSPTISVVASTSTESDMISYQACHWNLCRVPENIFLSIKDGDKPY